MSSSLAGQSVISDSSFSDSSSSAHSPSAQAFAFSPVARDNDAFYAQSHDTDLTSFMGSWDTSPTFGSSSSHSNGHDLNAKGKQKATASDLLSEPCDLRLDVSPHYRDEGANRPQLRPFESDFEFDLEFDQDINVADARLHTVSPLSLSDINDPHLHIKNDPISSSNPYYSISSSNFTPHVTEMTHDHSISSLSLKFPHTSSFDRIQRSLLRKKHKSRDSSNLELDSNDPSLHSPPFLSRPSSTSSLKKKFRGVFKRKDSKKHDVNFPANSDDEEENNAFSSLNQSTLSEVTISPRDRTSETDGQLEGIFPFDPTEAPLPSDELIAGAVTGEIKPLYISLRSSFFLALPRELQLRILKDVVSSHENEHHRITTSNTLLWTAKVAESTRWVGRERGMKELIQSSTVSKSWHSLVFDGQLWECVRFHPHLSLDQKEALSWNSNRLPSSFLLNLVKHARLFVRILDLNGWSHLDNATFCAVSVSLLKTHGMFDDDRGRPTYRTSHSSHDSYLSSPSSLYCNITNHLPAGTNLTELRLRMCTGLNMHNVRYILLRSPLLRVVDLHGLRGDVVNDLTCELLNAFCPNLEILDIGRCLGVCGTGLERLVRGSQTENSERDVAMQTRSSLKVLLASGIRDITPNVMFTLACFAPLLEVLDLSFSDITDEGIGAFVWWGEELAGDEAYRMVEVSSRHMVSLSPPVRFTFASTPTGRYLKRVTLLRHFSLSFTLITDDACVLLSHSVPKLEYLELAGIGAALGEEGLVKLFETTPSIRRIDLEDANRVDDAVLRALTPFVDGRASDDLSNAVNSRSTPLQPGYMLEHLILSYAHSITNNAFLLLIRSCTRLTTLEVDNTRVSCTVVRTFVEGMRLRGIRSAKIAVMDCRAFSESFVTELLDAGVIRPRLGFRAFEARAIEGFLDERDRSRTCPASSGPSACFEIDECDDLRVALKSFWAWKALDEAKEVEKKREKSGSGYTSGRLVIGFGSGPGSSMNRPKWLSNLTRYLI